VGRSDRQSGQTRGEARKRRSKKNKQTKKTKKKMKKQCKPEKCIGKKKAGMKSIATYKKNSLRQVIEKICSKGKKTKKAIGSHLNDPPLMQPIPKESEVRTTIVTNKHCFQRLRSVTWGKRKGEK